LKLELQRPLSPLLRIGAKVVVLIAAWLIACIPALFAIGLWLSYGGHAYAPEIMVVLLGHLLNAALTIGVAAAAAMITDHPSTAAIVTLAGTVGTWVLAFAGAVYGGIWARLADYTPAALVAFFQHGLVRTDVVLTGIVLAVTSIAIAAEWMRIGAPVRSRLLVTAAVVVVAVAGVAAASLVRGSWDASESRRNSFSVANEQAIGRIHDPLRIEAHLAPVDPRRLELERQALAKLRRAMPNVQVRYISRTTSGLYEGADPGYGEIWYELRGRRLQNRATTDESVLETIFELAGTPPPGDDGHAFPGYPLDTPPAGAAALFYGIWPLATAGLGFIILRRRR
jgi:hypothetical protein